MGNTLHAICLGLLIGAPPSLETASTAVVRERIGVDWGGVPDGIVARCRLGGLQNLLMQALIEADLALVQDAGPDELHLELSATPVAFTVTLSRGSERRAARVPIGTPCDGSIALALIKEGLQLVAAARASPQANAVSSPPTVAPLLPPVATPPPAVVAPPPAPAIEPTALRLRGGASLPGSRYALAYVAADLLLPIDAWGRVGPSIGVATMRYSDVWLVEAELALTLGTAIALDGVQLSGAFQAALVGHFFQAFDERGGHADGRFGALAELRLVAPAVGVWVAPGVRLGTVGHYVNGRRVYYSENLSILAGASWTFTL